MKVYPRRPEEILTCTQAYAYDIVLVSSVACDNSAGDCVWTGSFRVLTYNIEEPVTYNWTVDTGIINSGQDEKMCDIWITGDHPIEFEVSVTIDCPNGTSTKTLPFTTSRLG